MCSHYLQPGSAKVIEEGGGALIEYSSLPPKSAVSLPKDKQFLQFERHLKASPTTIDNPQQEARRRSEAETIHGYRTFQCSSGEIMQGDIQFTSEEHRNTASQGQKYVHIASVNNA